MVATIDKLILNGIFIYETQNKTSNYNCISSQNTVKCKFVSGGPLKMIYSQGMSCLDYGAKGQKPDHAVLWYWLGYVYWQVPGRDYIMMHANIVVRKFMSLQNISTAVNIHMLLQTDINIEWNMDVCFFMFHLW